MLVIGRHSCLWCLITSTEMNTPKSNRQSSQKRTFENLQQHLNDYRSNGSNPKTAKHYFNVIEEYYFNVPIENVRFISF